MEIHELECWELVWPDWLIIDYNQRYVFKRIPVIFHAGVPHAGNI